MCSYGLESARRDRETASKGSKNTVEASDACIRTMIEFESSRTAIRGYEDIEEVMSTLLCS